MKGRKQLLQMQVIGCWERAHCTDVALRLRSRVCLSVLLTSPSEFHRGLKEIDVSGNYRVKQENFVVIEKLICMASSPLQLE